MFNAWSFIRKVLDRGAAIQQDYMAGKYAGYEEYSARMDKLARDFADELEKNHEQKPEDKRGD
jgi:hypothetical protein